MLKNDIQAALDRGVKGRLITTTYQNFTDIESLSYFLKLAVSYNNFECHLDDECFLDEKNYSVNGFHSKGYIFCFEDRCELIVGSSNITRYALLKNIEWDLVIDCAITDTAFVDANIEYSSLWDKTLPLTQDIINCYSQKLNFAIERWDMDYYEVLKDAGIIVDPEGLNSEQLKIFKNIIRHDLY